VNVPSDPCCPATNTTEPGLRLERDDPFASRMNVDEVVCTMTVAPENARRENASPWTLVTIPAITLPVVAANVVEGVASVDRRLLEMGEVYRLSGWEAFRSIVIPSTIPHLVAGMKVGFGLALKVSVVAEIFGVTRGIGYIMNYSREILATQMVFVWALVMIAIMLVADKLVFDSLTRRLERWR